MRKKGAPALEAGAAQISSISSCRYWGMWKQGFPFATHLYFPVQVVLLLAAYSGTLQFRPYWAQTLFCQFCQAFFLADVWE
jgi:hypothetical protein